MKTRKEKIILFLALFFFCIKIWGQTDSIVFRVSTFDSFTEKPIPANVTVMNNDSATIALFPVTFNKDWEKYVLWATIPRCSSIILKTESEGYVTQYSNHKFGKKEKSRVLPNIFLEKDLSIRLKEVTVTGSRVKMVYNGDTVTYNAEAFKLANGSMLDALIKCLPGVELDDNGNISVNGEFVSELIVNGRSFFKGNPLIALKNLPAYYVKKVKAYHQVSKYKQFLYGDTVKVEKTEDPLVMDVVLKHEYQEGWLGNAEASHGISDEYLARLFGMRYTKRTGLFLYGNINNLNDSKSADKNGSWGNGQWAEGELSIKTGGINFNWEGKKSRSEFDTSLKIHSQTNDLQHKLSSEYYMTNGNTFNRSNSSSENKKTDVDWKGHFNYPGIGKNLYFDINSHLHYNNSNNHSWGRSASFDANPIDDYIGATIDRLFSGDSISDLSAMLVNQRELRSKSKGNSLDYGVETYSSIKIPKFKPINLSMSYNATDETLKIFQTDDLRYNQTNTSQKDDFRNKYEETPSFSSNLRLDLSSNLVETRSYRMSLRYTFFRNHSTGERNLYRLDEFLDISDIYGQLGRLPSTEDSLQQVIDFANSYQTISDDYNHSVNLSIMRYRGRITYSLNIPAVFSHQKIDDIRNQANKKYTRNVTTVSPKASVMWYYEVESKLREGSFDIAYDKDNVPMIYFLECRDNSNPLSLSLGNADLRDTENFRFSFRQNWRNKSSQINNILSGQFITSWNSISMSQTYESASGRSIYKPMNINGNWNSYLSHQFSMPLDKKRSLYFSNQASANFSHSNIFVTEVKVLSEDASPQRSSINNIRLSDKLRLIKYIKSTTLTFNGKIDYAVSHSSASSLSNMNAYDFNYGFAITQPLWWGIDLNAECMMWSHRGYSDKSMNNDELIVDATLSYACGKNKQLIFKLQTHDPFHQIRSVYYGFNAQGRTERWYNTTPSYIMLGIAYQFHKKPGNKEVKNGTY